MPTKKDSKSSACRLPSGQNTTPAEDIANHDSSAEGVERENSTNCYTHVLNEVRRLFPSEVFAQPHLQTQYMQDQLLLLLLAEILLNDFKLMTEWYLQSGFCKYDTADVAAPTSSHLSLLDGDGLPYGRPYDGNQLSFNVVRIKMDSRLNGPASTPTPTRTALPTAAAASVNPAPALTAAAAATKTAAPTTAATTATLYLCATTATLCLCVGPVPPGPAGPASPTTAPTATTATLYLCVGPVPPGPAGPASTTAPTATTSPTSTSAPTTITAPTTTTPTAAPIIAAPAVVPLQQGKCSIGDKACCQCPFDCALIFWTFTTALLFSVSRKISTAFSVSSAPALPASSLPHYLRLIIVVLLFPLGARAHEQAAINPVITVDGITGLDSETCGVGTAAPCKTIRAVSSVLQI